MPGHSRAIEQLPAWGLHEWGPPEAQAGRGLPPGILGFHVLCSEATCWRAIAPFFSSGEAALTGTAPVTTECPCFQVSGLGVTQVALTTADTGHGAALRPRPGPLCPPWPG